MQFRPNQQIENLPSIVNNGQNCQLFPQFSTLLQCTSSEKQNNIININNNSSNINHSNHNINIISKNINNSLQIINKNNNINYVGECSTNGTFQNVQNANQSSTKYTKY